MTLAQLKVPEHDDAAKKCFGTLINYSFLLGVTFGDLKYVNLLAHTVTRELLETADDKGNTPLILAVDGTQWNNRRDDLGADMVVKFIIDKMSFFEISLDVANSRGKTALMKAAKLGDVATVRHLINARADNELRDNKYGRTALAQAVENVENNGTEVLEALLNAGAMVDTVDNDGFTPLMYIASESGTCYVKAVELLLAACANPNAKKNGDSPLNIAISEACDGGIVELLLDYNSSTDCVENIPSSLRQVFEANFLRNQDKMLAFACGQHRGLGRNSSVQCLNREMVHAVWLCVEATSQVPEVMEEDLDTYWAELDSSGSDSSDSDSGN